MDQSAAHMRPSGFPLLSTLPGSSGGGGAGSVPLSGAGTIVTVGAAALRVARALTGAGNTATIGAVAAQIARKMLAAGSTATVGAGAARVARKMTAAGNAVTAGAGAATVARKMSGAGNAVTAGAGALTITAASTLILDSVAAAVGAYSCNDRLKTTYTGPLIRVRRSSDNTEQNIGYDGSNVLDRSALSTFCGAGNGFVTVVYDQTGATRNIVQTTQANQPQIYSAGAVLVNGGNVIMTFDGTNDVLARTDALSLAGNHAFTAFMLWRINSASGTRQALQLGNDYILGFTGSTSMIATNNANPGNNLYPNGVNTAYHYDTLTYAVASSTEIWYQNASALTPTTYTASAANFTNNQFRIGYNTASDSISTVIVWDVVLGAPDRATLHAWAEVRRLL